MQTLLRHSQTFAGLIVIKNILMKTTLYTLCILLFTLSLQAQVGIGTTAPQAAFDVTSTNSGILIPRVALTSLSDISPLTVGTESELVYNTEDINDVTPGFYYLSSATGPWVRFGGATGWLTTGNADITATSFMGTTNNFDVAFRRNGFAAGKIGLTSTSYGLGALANGASTNSTAIGHNALSVSTGSNNVAVGQNALQNSATTAQWNTAVGNSALGNINNAAAQENVAVGYFAMANGAGNISRVVAIGTRALFQNTVSNSVAIGYNALQGQVGSAVNNTGVGYSVLNNNTTGDNNTVLGYEAGFAATGSNNTLIGNVAGRNLGSGSNNIIIGSNVNGAPNTDNQLSIGNWIYGSAGNIGIGIAAPTQKLDVDGIVRAQSFISISGTYADYVFEDYFTGVSKIKSDYKFIPLENAEAFVKKNGHLPGVKSYTEVMEGGFKLDLTDATITNLEKLEEQFLYIVELNKKIKTQENTIKTQEAKIEGLESRLERIEKLLEN